VIALERRQIRELVDDREARHGDVGRSCGDEPR
jgi:hypothetical protein